MISKAELLRQLESERFKLELLKNSHFRLRDNFSLLMDHLNLRISSKPETQTIEPK